MERGCASSRVPGTPTQLSPNPWICPPVGLATAWWHPKAVGAARTGIWSHELGPRPLGMRKGHGSTGWALHHSTPQILAPATPLQHCPMGWQGTRWPWWQQRWPRCSCPSPGGPAASCSCHITILPRACPNNRRRCGGSSRKVVALPAELVSPETPRCPAGTGALCSP